MEALLYVLLTFIGLGVLWALVAILMAIISFLLTMLTATLAAMAAFFTGRWLWEKLNTDYSEEDKADKT